MIGELDVLSIVSERLDTAGLPFMLTGSYAMAWYTTPRMTRDLDIVVAMMAYLDDWAERLDISDELKKLSK